MSEEIKGETLNTPASTDAGKSTNEVTKEPVEVKAPEGYVSRAELEHVLKDLHKAKEKSNELEKTARKEEETRLRETENWKRLAEIKGQEAEEATQKLSKIETSLVEEKKYSAVKEAAMKAGIRPEALSDLGLLGLNDVVVEATSTGRVNVLGAERFVDQLKTIRPHWFGKANLNLNGALPETKKGSIASVTELIKLSEEAAKTGDYTTYKAKMKLYQQQK